jgi:Fur family iron response transcriptional regulator
MRNVKIGKFHPCASQCGLRGTYDAYTLRCPSERAPAALRGCGPTRQRVALGDLLFAKGRPAPDGRGTARRGGHRRRAGLACHRLQHAAPVHRSRPDPRSGGGGLRSTYFDTNVSDHHHFFIEGENEVLDIPVSNNRQIGNLPEARRKAWKSPMWTWSSACAASAAEGLAGAIPAEMAPAARHFCVQAFAREPQSYITSSGCRPGRVWPCRAGKHQPKIAARRSARHERACRTPIA